LQRTIATARFLPKDYQQLEWKALDELDSGVCDGMTYKEIAEKYPEDFKARDDDKYNYRYRGGESYRDVVIRLEPIIMELERSENILIVTHQAVLRCIYAYFKEKGQEESPWMAVSTFAPGISQETAGLLITSGASTHPNQVDSACLWYRRGTS
jgi:6-phosphofructo-2-kinase/fructose-2,6-biphosphatase 2